MFSKSKVVLWFWNNSIAYSNAGRLNNDLNQFVLEQTISTTILWTVKIHWLHTELCMQSYVCISLFECGYYFRNMTRFVFNILQCSITLRDNRHHAAITILSEIALKRLGWHSSGQIFNAAFVPLYLLLAVNLIGSRLDLRLENI